MTAMVACVEAVFVLVIVVINVAITVVITNTIILNVMSILQLLLITIVMFLILILIVHSVCIMFIHVCRHTVHIYRDMLLPQILNEPSFPILSVNIFENYPFLLVHMTLDNSEIKFFFVSFRSNFLRKLFLSSSSNTFPLRVISLS